MIQMEFAKFMFKFNNQMLANSFDEYFIKLGKIHIKTLGKNIVMSFFNPI